MKMVIEISDIYYESVMSDAVWCGHIEIHRAIKYGTPLPKGHGRLIDADEFVSKHFGEPARLVNEFPTVIEADTACLNPEKLNKVKQDFKQDLNKNDEMFGDYMSPIV